MQQPPEYPGSPSAGPSLPPPAPGVPPNRRQGAPWWAWLLGGCAGCGVVTAVLVFFLVTSATGFVRSLNTSVGPVTVETVQQSLGGVPLYPGSQLDTGQTRTMLVTLRAGENLVGKMSDKDVRGVISGLAMLSTSDPPDKVLAYYDKQLQADGWQVDRSQDTAFQEERIYTKRGESVIVQTQQQPGGTIITLMRGGRGMTAPAPDQDPRQESF